MGAKTGISWCDSTWSPLRARVRSDAAEIATQKGYTSLVQIAGKMAGHVGPHCEPASSGCNNCYSGANNSRCLPGNGTGLPFDRRSRDLLEFFVDKKILLQPLKWREPRRIFVNSQTDTWGEWVPDEFIDRLFAVAALCPQHTFQFLTKRAGRMLAYCSAIRWDENANERGEQVQEQIYQMSTDETINSLYGWPLDNVWMGVSCEDQATADARIPLLIQTPAAKRFVSYEPALDSVNFSELPSVSGIGRHLDSLSSAGVDPGAIISTKLDWVIIGGESGPGARPFDIQWAWDTVEACRDADVACFVKQTGSRPFVEVDNLEGWHDISNFRMKAGELVMSIKLKSRSGSDPAEWPADLRVQEFPQ